MSAGFGVSNVGNRLVQIASDRLARKRGPLLRWDRIGAVALSTTVRVMVIGLVLSVIRCGWEASR